MYLRCLRRGHYNYSSVIEYSVSLFGPHPIVQPTSTKTNLKNRERISFTDPWDSTAYPMELAIPPSSTFSGNHEFPCLWEACGKVHCSGSDPPLLSLIIPTPGVSSQLRSNKTLSYTHQWATIQMHLWGLREAVQSQYYTYCPSKNAYWREAFHLWFYRMW